MTKPPPDPPPTSIKIVDVEATKQAFLKQLKHGNRVNPKRPPKYIPKKDFYDEIVLRAKVLCGISKTDLARIAKIKSFHWYDVYKPIWDPKQIKPETKRQKRLKLILLQLGMLEPVYKEIPVENTCNKRLYAVYSKRKTTEDKPCKSTSQNTTKNCTKKPCPENPDQQPSNQNASNAHAGTEPK